MNTRALCLISLLASLPVLAQDYSVALSWAHLKSVARASTTFGGLVGAYDSQYPSGTASATGVHFAWAATSFGPLALEITAAYQAPCNINQTNTYSWYLPTEVYGTGSTSIRLTESYAGLGARLAGHTILDWSVGVEYRAEFLRLENGPTNWPGSNGPATISSNIGRPWVQAGLGYTFPSIMLKPFVAATWAVPLITKDADGGFDSTLVQAMAPKVEMALQAGIRF